MLSFQIIAEVFTFFFAEYSMLNSPPTITIDRNPIVARKSEYACGNSMHLSIEFIFESPAS